MESIFKKNISLSRIVYPLKSSNLITESHLLLSLYFFYKHSQGGRYALSRFLNINESKTRTIMNKLIESKVIISSKGRIGSNLTDFGINLCKELFSYCKIINFDNNLDLGILSVGTINGLVALPIDDSRKMSIEVLNLRDSIIRNGTSGATIFRFIIENGSFSLNFYQQEQTTSKMDKSYQKAFENLVNLIKSHFTHDKYNYHEWLLVAGTFSYKNTRKDKNYSKKIILREVIRATLQGLVDFGF